MKRPSLKGRFEETTSSKDDQITEAIADSLSANDKVIEIRPAKRSKGMRLQRFLLLGAGAIGFTYWIRSSQKPADLIKGVKEKMAAKIHQATETIEEGSEAASDRIEAGSERASEAVQEAGEKAAEQAEETGEKAAEQAEETGKKAAEQAEETGEKAAEQTEESGEKVVEKMVQGNGKTSDETDSDSDSSED